MLSKTGPLQDGASFSLPPKIQAHERALSPLLHLLCYCLVSAKLPEALLKDLTPSSGYASIIQRVHSFKLNLQLFARYWTQTILKMHSKSDGMLSHFFNFLSFFFLLETGSTLTMFLKDCSARGWGAIKQISKLNTQSLIIKETISGDM